MDGGPKPIKRTVFRVERLFDVNGEFNVLSRFYIDSARFPKFVQLNARDLRSTNLKRLHGRMHRLPMITHHETLHFQSFPAEVCLLLKCGAGSLGAPAVHYRIDRAQRRCLLP